MSQAVMSTGTVAKELGVSTSLLRTLEKAGAIPPAQRIAGLDRRLYSAEDVERLRYLLAQRKAERHQRRKIAA